MKCSWLLSLVSVLLLVCWCYVLICYMVYVVIISSMLIRLVVGVNYRLLLCSRVRLSSSVIGNVSSVFSYVCGRVRVR